MNTPREVVHKSKFVIFTVLLYSFLIGIISIYHEPWRDEAQSWLIARDLNIISVFKHMPYDGTPALWHIILFPFTKIGLPYSTASIIHFIIAIIAVYIFISHSPFSKITKLLFIFSYYMAYEYSIIVRNYSISILLLFLIAAFYEKRFERPIKYSILVLLLFNTNFSGFFIAVSLTSIFIWEFFKKKCKRNLGYIAISIMCLGGLASLIQLFPARDYVHYRFIGQFNYLKLSCAIRDAFFPSRFIIPGGNVKSLAVFVLCITVLSLVNKPTILFFILMCYSLLFYIYAHISTHGTHLRHHGFILIILLVAIWIGENTCNVNKIKLKSKLINDLLNIHLAKYTLAIINLCLAISVVYSVEMYYKELKFPFSGAKDAASFIIRNHLDNYTIVVHPPYSALAILPYLPRMKFWYAVIKDYGTFITCDKKYQKGSHITNLEAIARAAEAFPVDKIEILFLFQSPINEPHLFGLKLLYKTDKKVFGYGCERFYLYKRIGLKEIKREL